MSKVVVVEYDPGWPETFARLRDAVWPAVAEHAHSIEHVGSTSVPGLAAKPVIDMTIVVRDDAGLPRVIASLADIGYTHRGDLGVAGREAFRAPAALPRHHLYACVAGDKSLMNHLAVRDTLRGDAERAQAYGDLKQQLATRFPDDMESYLEGKTDFILGILDEAGFDSGELDAIREINRDAGREP